MAVELSQLKRDVRYYPLFVYCLLNLFIIQTHVYLACMIAFFWLSETIFGVAVNSLFSELLKQFGVAFGALLVDYAE